MTRNLGGNRNRFDPETTSHDCPTANGDTVDRLLTNFGLNHLTGHRPCTRYSPTLPLSLVCSIPVKQFDQFSGHRFASFEFCQNGIVVAQCDPRFSGENGRGFQSFHPCSWNKNSVTVIGDCWLVGPSQCLWQRLIRVGSLPAVGQPEFVVQPRLNLAVGG